MFRLKWRDHFLVKATTHLFTIRYSSENYDLTYWNVVHCRRYSDVTFWMSHFGKTVQSKLTVIFPVTLSGVSSFGIPYEDLSFVPAWEVPRRNLIYSSNRLLIYSWLIMLMMAHWPPKGSKRHVASFFVIWFCLQRTISGWYLKTK